MWVDFLLWEFEGVIILKASGKRNKEGGEEEKQREWKEER